MDKSVLEQRISDLEIELSKLKHIKSAEDFIPQSPIENAKKKDEDFQALSIMANIVERSPNALWISDQHGSLTILNRACRDILRIKEEEVIGKYNILKDNILESQDVMPQVKDVFEKGKTVHFTGRNFDMGELPFGKIAI